MTDQDAAVRSAQDALYVQATAEFGPALVRLAAATEHDPTAQRDLLQDIHMSLWLSFAGYLGQCSLRTWVYRVAHNAAATHVRKRIRQRRDQLMDLEELERNAPVVDTGAAEDEAALRERLYQLIRQLKPIDRDVMLLYLEDHSHREIGEVLGISEANAATKLSRLKQRIRQEL